jgi:hypothetical protein
LIEDPPRILHVCTRYRRGGSERRIRDIITSLPEAVHHLIVGADSDASLAQSETSAAAVRVLDSLTRTVRPFHDLVAAAALARVVRQYDVVVAHQSKASALVRMVAFRRPSVSSSVPSSG